MKEKSHGMHQGYSHVSKMKFPLWIHIWLYQFATRNLLFSKGHWLENFMNVGSWSCAFPHNSNSSLMTNGWWQKVHISFVKKCPNRAPFLLFHGVMESLDFNLEQWIWSDGAPWMEYTMKKGKKLLNSRD
jgi:hypothetical protein